MGGTCMISPVKRAAAFRTSASETPEGSRSQSTLPVASCVSVVTPSRKSAR